MFWTMIRNGISLSQSVELTSQWDRILAIGPVYPVLLLILMFVGVLVLVSFIVLFPMFIVVSVISFMQLLSVVGMRLLGGGRNGFGRILWFILTSGLGLICFLPPFFFNVSLILRLVFLGFLLIRLRWTKNSERPSFPTFVSLGKGIPALRNSVLRLKVGIL